MIRQHWPSLLVGIEILLCAFPGRFLSPRLGDRSPELAAPFASLSFPGRTSTLFERCRLWVARWWQTLIEFVAAFVFFDPTRCLHALRQSLWRERPAQQRGEEQQRQNPIHTFTRFASLSSGYKAQAE